MSYFSAELAALIERRFGGSQLKFGRAVGIDQSVVSRQCAGLALPDRVTVQRLTQALSETQSIPLVVAYLQDHCPVSLRPKVAISSRAPLAQQLAVDALQLDLSQYSVRQRSLIRQLTMWVASDPNAMVFLASVLKFMGHTQGVGPGSA